MNRTASKQDCLAGRDQLIIGVKLTKAYQVPLYGEIPRWRSTRMHQAKERSIEQQSKRVCDCGQFLTAYDFDGKCLRCRGNKLTLYPKTSAVRAEAAHFNEYCRKKNRDYEPSAETLSDYFWRCQQCAERLGAGYRGEPDERGVCDACVCSEQVWAKRKAETIEAAGGIKAWQRKKLVNKLLTPVDFIAMFGGFLFAGCIALVALARAVTGVWREITSMWSNSDDRVLLIIAIASTLWCAVRWKALNSKPPPF